MAQYWVCPLCETASLTWPALRWHIKGKHPGEPIPEKEQIQVTEEALEGYRVIGQYKKGVAAPAVEKTGEGTKEPEKLPKVEVTVPVELPEDFTERVKLSLGVHNFPDRLTNQILNVLALHPETHDNPNNFANLLIHICSTYAGGAVHARKIALITSEVFGQPTSEVPYAGSYGAPQGGYYGGFQQPGGFYGAQPGAPPHHEDPISRWINYQMYKESKEEEKGKETREARLPPVLEAKLAEQEKFYQETRNDLSTVIEKLDKQEAEDKESAHKAEMAELRAEIRSMSESKKGGESDWLKAYLDEKDKRDADMQDRYQATIKDLGDKLASATKDVAETRREIDRKVADAITSERTAREQYKKDMEASGYAPKTKTKEELDHEIQKTLLEVVPDKIDKGFDRLADRIAPLGTVQTKPTSTQEVATTRTPQQIAEQAGLEETILEEARKRSKA